MPESMKIEARKQLTYSSLHSRILERERPTGKMMKLPEEFASIVWEKQRARHV